MAVNVINCGSNALPRSLDVEVTVTRPSAETTTDLSVPVFVQKGGSFNHGADRVAFYSSMSAVEDDNRVTAEGLKAARDFFSQPRRPSRMAIGQAFDQPVAGYMDTGVVNVQALAAVTDGSFSVAIDGDDLALSALNFTSATSASDVASVIQAAVDLAGRTGVLVQAVGSRLRITSSTTGDGSTVSVLGAVDPASGTDISGEGFLNGHVGVAVVIPGYTPTGLVGEMSLIAEAARCSGSFLYGWALDAAYRDTDEQIQAGQWVQARTGVIPLVSNSPVAWDPNSVTDVGPEIVKLGAFRAWPYYHDRPDFYPDMALLAVILSVNYSQRKSTITAKFKDLVGIPTVGITETQWAVLSGKGYNSFTLTGNTSRVNRDGTTGNVAWFMDDVVNLDNLVEELQVAEYNCFLRHGKVPNDVEGQALMEDPLQQVCEKYIFNGTLSPRRVLDKTQSAGFRIDPAYAIIPTPLELMTAADRADRVGPPFVIDVNLAGAMHSISINLNAYS